MISLFEVFTFYGLFLGIFSVFIFPRFIFRVYFSAFIFQRLFFRVYFSVLIFPYIKMRKCQIFCQLSMESYEWEWEDTNDSWIWNVDESQYGAEMLMRLTKVFTQLMRFVK